MEKKNGTKKLFIAETIWFLVLILTEILTTFDIWIIFLYACAIIALRGYPVFLLLFLIQFIIKRRNISIRERKYYIIMFIYNIVVGGQYFMAWMSV